MTNKLEFDDAPRQFSSLNIMGGGDGKTSDAKQRSEKKPSGPKIVEISDDGAFDLSANEPPPLDDDEPPPLGEAEAAAAPASASASPPSPAASEPPASAAAAAAEVDEGPSLMDQMMADANVAQEKKKTSKKVEQQRMKQSFGDGLKGNLKKGFLSGGTSGKSKKASGSGAAKKPAKPGASQSSQSSSSGGPPVAVIETLRPQRDSSGGLGDRTGAMQKAIKEEVASAMSEQQHPMAAALKNGEWVTPELLQRIAASPKITRAMADPRFQTALELMGKEPRKAMSMFDAEPHLKEALEEFCQQMGGHFEGMQENVDATKGSEAARQQQQGGATTSAAANTPPPPPPPPGAPGGVPQEEDLGPMERDALARHRSGATPPPAKPEEQEQIDKVLADAELRDILMDPAMQNLMRQCSDPAALQKAMRDPAIRAKFEKLAQAGLIKIER